MPKRMPKQMPRHEDSGKPATDKVGVTSDNQPDLAPPGSVKQGDHGAADAKRGRDERKQ